MKIQSAPSAEPQLRVDRPLPNLLVQGFQLALRNWPCLVWVYAANLFFSLLAGVPVAAGLASYVDHSFAAQRIASTINLSALMELGFHLRDTGFFPMALHTAGWINLLQLTVLFVLFAGSVFVFVSAEPPRLSVLLRGGVAYFWRFVRAALLAGLVAAVLLGMLLSVRAAALSKASAIYVERQMFLYSAMSGGVVVLVALLVRLWWDLVEVYLVRNAMDGERRVRQALLPALRLLGRYFFRTAGSFLLTGLAGVTALALCLLLWKVVPAHQVWLAALLAQLGLLFLLAGRFWQRGVETALVMSADPPRVAVEEIATEESALVLEEDTPVAANVEYLSGLSEPTLRDLVLKLRTAPLANAEAPGPVQRSTTESAPANPVQVNDPTISLLDRHITKFPLGGSTPGKEADPADYADQPELPEEKTPHAEKKPLP